MRRFNAFRTGVSQSSGQDRQAALTGLAGQLSGLNGKLAPGGMLPDGTPTRGNENTREAKVTFQKPGLPALAVHDFRHTVTNWTPIDIKPPATIGRSRRRPTNAGIWLEATGAVVNADGKFDPPVVAIIKMWGERGQEPRR